MEEQIDNRLKCPKCKTEIMVEIKYEGYILNRKKVFNYYCPLCDFKNRIVFMLNESSYQKEIE
jgi:rubredoxin